MDASLWNMLANTPAPRMPALPKNVRHICADEQDVFLSDLRTALNGLVLPSEQVQSIRASISAVVEDNDDAPPGSKTIAALTAPFAAGKSTAITGWAYEKHRLWTGTTAIDRVPLWEPEPGMTANLVPVVYLSLVSSAGVKELNAQILAFLGYPGEGIARVTTAKVTLALRRHGVRILIVDDAHMLRLTDRTSRQVLDYLKSLNSELGFLGGTMILVGADLTDTPILADPQIRGRLRLFEISPPEISSIPGRREWQRFLRGAEEILLPFLPTCQPTIFSSQWPGLVWQRTQGYFGDAARLMNGSLMNALNRRAKTIAEKDIQQVHLSQRALDEQAEMRVRRRKGATRGKAASTT